MDLAQWRKHIDAVVRDEGQWVGISDENGLPLYELSGTLTFPESHLSAASAEVTVQVQPGDRVLDDLVGDGLGEVDAEGRLVPHSGQTRLLVLVRAGERRAATVTHSVVSGVSVPSQIVVHGVDLLDGLSTWPCPSIPAVWESAEFSEWSTDASGEQYATKRDLAQVQFTTRIDHYLERGPAKTVLREVIQDSFDAVNTLNGWSDDPHAVVAYESGEDTSPEIIVRINDDPVMDTIAEHARSAGVGIEVGLWWPGDDPVTVRVAHDSTETKQATWPHPIQVVRLTDFREA